MMTSFDQSARCAYGKQKLCYDDAVGEHKSQRLSCVVLARPAASHTYIILALDPRG